jgi:hypothetical protein
LKIILAIILNLMLILCLFISTLTCGKYNPPNILVETIGLLAFGTLGLTSIDFFTNKKKNENQE